LARFSAAHGAGVGEVLVQRDRFGIVWKIFIAASMASAVIGEDSTPASFLNSLAKPGSLKDFAMASRQMLTS